MKRRWSIDGIFDAMSKWALKQVFFKGKEDPRRFFKSAKYKMNGWIQNGLSYILSADLFLALAREIDTGNRSKSRRVRALSFYRAF